MNLIWFSLRLGGEILWTWKGNTISDSFPLISSEKMRATETWCHFSAFQNFCPHYMSDMSDHVRYRWKASILGALKLDWVNLEYFVRLISLICVSRFCCVFVGRTTALSHRLAKFMGQFCFKKPEDFQEYVFLGHFFGVRQLSADAARCMVLGRPWCSASRQWAIST